MAQFGVAQITNKSGVDFKDTRQYGDTSKFSDLFSVDTKETDGPTGLNDVTYQSDWTKWHGYYRSIDILAAITDTKARWTVGDSFEADKKTKEKLLKIKGFGKDTFNSIIYNQLRTALICGDSYSEIIRDKAGRLVNLKLLNSGSIKIVVDEFGILKEYVQTAQVGTKGEINFQKKDIFHLPYNRIADEIHGVSDYEKVEDLVKKLKELIGDYSTIIHRYVKPLTMWKVKTDDATEISNFRSQVDNAWKQSENLIVPDETVVGVERVSVPQYSTLDPLPFIASIKQDITKALGVPEVILGWGGDTTEASSKILYLAFEQMVKFHQKWLEEQIKEQIGIDVQFNFPASIEPNLQTDTKKDRGQIQPKGMEANKDE